MGTVYRGHDDTLDRDGAIKLLAKTGLGTEGRARLLQEAKAIAKLNYPNIVTVYDAGETDETALVGDRIARAWHVIGDFLSLSESEEEYVTAVSGGDLALKLLFPANSAEVEHLTKHPALAWKIQNVRAQLNK